MGKLNPRQAPNGGLQKKVIKLTNKTLAVSDNAGVTAYAGLLIHTFVEGFVKFEGAYINLSIEADSAGINATFDGDVGLGTVTSAVTTPLATTEQNLVPTTAIAQAVASVALPVAISTATETGVFFDGSTTPVPVYLNFKIDDADHDVTGTPANLILHGSVTIWYQEMGDV
jgi:hypothetical protein